MDSDGAPISGSVSITFRLYSAQTDGTERWSQSMSVTLDNGYYSVTLGPGDPDLIEVMDGTPLFLGVEMSGISEFEPRHPVTSVPYAFRARTADKAVEPSEADDIANKEYVDNSLSGHSHGTAYYTKTEIDNQFANLADPSSGSEIHWDLLTGIPSEITDGEQGISSEGDINYLAKFQSSDVLENSLLFDDGTNVGLGTAEPSVTLDVVGDGRFTGNLQVEGIIQVKQQTSTPEAVSEFGMVYTKFGNLYFLDANGVEHQIQMVGEEGGGEGILSREYQYWRVIVSKVQNGGDQIQITEIGFRDEADTLFSDLAATITYGNHSAGTLGNVYNGGFANSDQTNFDGVNGDNFVQFDWDFGERKTFLKLVLGQSDSPPRFPEDLMILASNDGVSYDTVVDLVGWKPESSIEEKNISILNSFMLRVDGNAVDEFNHFVFETTEATVYNSTEYASGTHSLMTDVWGSDGGSPADYALISQDESTLWSLDPSIGDFEFEWSYRVTGDNGYGSVILTNTDAWVDSTSSYLNTSSSPGTLPDGWMITIDWQGNYLVFNAPSGVVSWSYGGLNSDWKKIRLRRIGNQLELFFDNASQGTRTMPSISDSGASKLIICGSPNGGQSAYNPHDRSLLSQMDDIRFLLLN